MTYTSQQKSHIIKDIMRRKELTLTETEKNIEKIFKLIGMLLVTAFCITVIYISFCTN